jgi:hypothetical protein
MAELNPFDPRGLINPVTWRQLQELIPLDTDSGKDFGDDGDGSAGDGEPRNPLPVAPQAGLVAVSQAMRQETDTYLPTN